MVTLVIMAVFSLAAGWLIAGRFVRPLRAIITTARDISASNLHRRLGVRGRADEFTELGQTLDDLFGRLEASFQRGEGHGLGLAIVRAIADAHGAALTARARPGGGLDIEVTFPRLPAGQMLHSAWTGDRRAARMAGSSPAAAPMSRAAARPPPQASGGMPPAQASGGMTTASPWPRA